MNDETYKKIVMYLEEIVPVRPASSPINPETEIYKDLGLYGDDVYEFLLWIEKEFGVRIMVAFGKVVPSESPLFWVREAFKRAGGHSYKSFKVRDIVQAIDAGGGKFD